MSRVLLLTSAALISSMACAGQAGSSPQVPPTAADPDTVYIATADPAALGNTFSAIAEQVGPTVVTITSRTTVRAAVPWFWGFDAPRQQEFVRQGLGSGVIMTPDGYIVTNNHVVSGADELEVILQDGSRHPAEVVGTDDKTDLAVIHIQADSLPSIRMGDSDSLKVGEWVLAIGSPFALSQTVTQGIISYIGRTGVGLADYENYIQTDAAINPGNSGGAMVNLRGEIVGINSAIASSTGGYEGIGFAIPVNTVRSVLQDLIDLGYVSRGWLGVMIQDLTPALASQFGEQGTAGVLISEVDQGTPADQAGLQRGDIVLSVDGVSVSSASDFRNRIAAFDPGTEVELQVSRDGGHRTIRARLGQVPGSEAPASRSADSTLSDQGKGWAARNLDAYSARAIGYTGTGGVVVTSVDPGSQAEAAGLRQGDVILEVGRQAVSTVDEMHRRIAASGGDALLLVWREGHTLYLVIPSS